MGKENQCTFTILSWMRFERYGETKVPKYRLAEQRGRYRPMEEALQGKDGERWFLLNVPRRTGEGLPEFYLQARSGLNISGMFRIMKNGKLTRTFYGYPNRTRETAVKRPVHNPFYPSNVEDSFIIQFRTLEPRPEQILIIAVSGQSRFNAKAIAEEYAYGRINDPVARFKAENPDILAGHAGL